MKKHILFNDELLKVDDPSPLTEAQVGKLLVDNPKRFFEGA